MLLGSVLLGSVLLGSVLLGSGLLGSGLLFGAGAVWGRIEISVGSVMRVAIDPLRFVREVRSESAKVTWPSRKETLVTTGLVVAMATVAAIFFFIIDQIIGVGVRALFGVAG